MDVHVWYIFIASITSFCFSNNCLQHICKLSPFLSSAIVSNLLRLARVNTFFIIIRPNAYRFFHPSKPVNTHQVLSLDFIWKSTVAVI